MTELYPHSSHYPLFIFSSHAWRHSHHRAGLHDILAPDWSKGVEFHDLSVPEAHPLETFGSNRLLVKQLAERIKASDIVLMMAGMYANNSDWMRAEATLAAEHDKPVIPVAPLGQERLASTATAFASHPTVRWRGSSIREAVLDAINPQVRANFLAAKAWREQERVAAFTRLPTFRRLTAQDVYGSPNAYEPAPRGAIGWASALNAYGAPPKRSYLNLFNVTAEIDPDEDGVIGALARYSKR